MSLGEEELAPYANFLGLLEFELHDKLSSLLNRNIQVKTVDAAKDALTSLLKNSANSLMISAPVAEPADTGGIYATVSIQDACRAADLMMGGSGKVDAGATLDDMTETAAGEILRQSLYCVIERLASLSGSKNVDLGTVNSEIVSKDSDLGLDTSLDNLVLTLELKIAGLGSYNAYVGISIAFVDAISNEFSGELVSYIENVGTQAEEEEVEESEEEEEDDGVIVNEGTQLRLLSDVNIDVVVELGRSQMLLRDIMSIAEGAVIESDRLTNEPVDLYVSNTLIARGEVVVIDDNFGFKITDKLGNLNLASII